MSTTGSNLPAPGPTSLSPIVNKLKRILAFGRSGSVLTTSVDRGIERYRRVSITASTSFVSKLLTILIGFASVPLTVHYLGAERYGVWLVISSLLTWMSLTDFGLAGNALINVIAEASGKDNRQLAREYAASAFWALTAISAALGLVSLAVFHLVPWAEIFRVSSGVSIHELKQACALTLLMFVLALPLNMIPSIYSAYQDGFVSNVWSIASNLSALVSLVIVSRFHGGLPLLVVALSGTRIIVTVASGWYAFFRRYTWLVPAWSSVRWNCISRLFKLGGKYMITQLAALGIYQSQPMIITQMLGPAEVTIFVVAYKIIALPIDFAYMATVPFVSAFSEAKSRGEWGWIKGAYKNATMLSLAVGLPLIAVIAVIAKPFIRVWAGPAAVPGTGLIVWLSVYSLVSVAMMAAGHMFSGLERLNQLALSSTLCALSIIGLGILFAPRWGLGGVALAMAVSKVFTFLPVQVLETRRIMAMAKTQPVAPECELVV